MVKNVLLLYDDRVPQINGVINLVGEFYTEDDYHLFIAKISDSSGRLEQAPDDVVVNSEAKQETVEQEGSYNLSFLKSNTIKEVYYESDIDMIVLAGDKEILESQKVSSFLWNHLVSKEMLPVLLVKPPLGEHSIDKVVALLKKHNDNQSKLNKLEYILNAHKIRFHLLRVISGKDDLNEILINMSNSAARSRLSNYTINTISSLSGGLLMYVSRLDADLLAGFPQSGEVHRSELNRLVTEVLEKTDIPVLLC